jgi:ribulose kinase
MIDSQCFTAEWIATKSKEYQYPDRNIIEKVIRAFSLLDMLAASGCPFHFKGLCVAVHKLFYEQ